jgi:hypothetical protein
MPDGEDGGSCGSTLSLAGTPTICARTPPGLTKSRSAIASLFHPSAGVASTIRARSVGRTDGAFISRVRLRSA